MVGSLQPRELCLVRDTVYAVCEGRPGRRLAGGTAWDCENAHDAISSRTTEVGRAVLSVYPFGTWRARDGSACLIRLG